MKKKKLSAKQKQMSISPNRKDDYEMDFYGWTRKQAALLQKQEFEKLDITHLIEEMDSLGRSEKRSLESHISILFMHLLKIKYQPEKHTRSWDNSVKNSIFQSQKILKENPSLKPKLDSISKDAYYSARLNASSETGLRESTFPKKCQWDIKKLLYPENGKKESEKK
ncbi:MAG: DUF29 domain-containing protein [Pseudomonadota bacterium]